MALRKTLGAAVAACAAATLLAGAALAGNPNNPGTGGTQPGHGGTPPGQVKKGTTGITPDTACGKKIAVQKSTVEVDDLTKKSAACKSAGPRPLGVVDALGLPCESLITRAWQRAVPSSAASGQAAT